MKKKEESARQRAGLKDAVQSQLNQSYHSSLIDKIRKRGFHLKQGRLDIYLAKEFGFCYGVERAVEYAYETRSKFPDRRIFLTDEIIHNPRVNQELRSLGVQFLSGSSASGVEIDEVEKEDVVIMPAFGLPVEFLKAFRKRGCVIVDTTCGSVMSVWKRVESYAKDGLTSVIHGKYDHEETRATCSRAGKYLVIKDKEQARLVCDYISGNAQRATFNEKFTDAHSESFDPDKDLGRVGFANQTTMLMRESIEISNMLRDAIEARYGKEELAERFQHFDTICSATQDRQDAVKDLGEEKMDVMLVIGGYKSSNTGHLAEIAANTAPTFHVEDASCLVSAEIIRHKTIGSSEIQETHGWLKRGQTPFLKMKKGSDPLKIGITAGASTPNRVIEEVIQRLVALAG